MPMAGAPGPRDLGHGHAPLGLKEFGEATCPHRARTCGHACDRLCTRSRVRAAAHMHVHSRMSNQSHIYTLHTHTARTSAHAPAWVASTSTPGDPSLPARLSPERGQPVVGSGTLDPRDVGHVRPRTGVMRAVDVVRGAGVGPGQA